MTFYVDTDYIVQECTYGTSANDNHVLFSLWDNEYIRMTAGTANNKLNFYQFSGDKITGIYGIKHGSGGGGGASAISDLTDVNLTSLANGQVLKYNSTTQEWENADVSGGGGPSQNITDISTFTKIYDTANSYGSSGTKISSALDRTNEFNIAIMMNSGWNASGSSYYDSENHIGAYGGYEFNAPLRLDSVRIYMGRYSGQNANLVMTAQYLDSNNNWIDIDDYDISTTLAYPINCFDVPLSNLGEIYGVRWIHKKEPNKTNGNNMIFFDMLLYEYHSGGGGTSDLDAIELTKAEYDAFTTEEKNDPNKIYFVTDYPSGGDEKSYEETVLFTGDNTTTTGEITLLDDITNYDQLIVWVSWNTTSANGQVPFMVDAKYFHDTFVYDSCSCLIVIREW